VARRTKAALAVGAIFFILVPVLTYFRVNLGMSNRPHPLPNPPRHVFVSQIQVELSLTGRTPFIPSRLKSQCDLPDETKDGTSATVRPSATHFQSATRPWPCGKDMKFLIAFTPKTYSTARRAAAMTLRCCETEAWRCSQAFTTRL
jgi:hypothetical protein